MTYHYTWPKEENMKNAIVFSSGIYRTSIVEGKARRHKPVVWVTGQVCEQNRVRDVVETIANQLTLRTYGGPDRVDVNLKELYRRVGQRCR